MPRLQKMIYFLNVFWETAFKCKQVLKKLFSRCLCIYVLEYGENCKLIIKYKVVIVSNNMF